MSDGPVNTDELEWTDYDHGDRQFRRKQLGAAAGGEDIGTSHYEVPAGKRLWLRHYHEGNEEAIFVLAGRGTLWLGPDATEYTLEPEDYVALPAGEESTHEIAAGDDGLRLLMYSTMEDPDITIYPDRNKVGLYGGSPPGGDSDERSISAFLDREVELDYWED